LIANAFGNLITQLTGIVWVGREHQPQQKISLDRRLPVGLTNSSTFLRLAC
jgi:hypothetical protein